ncbi:hypothetical protein ACLI4Y_15705 [Natrialbaceae archaeon A-CW3]
MIKRLYTRVCRLFGRDSRPADPNQQQSDSEDDSADDSADREIDGSGNPIIDEVYNGQFTAAKEIQSIQEQASEVEELEKGR